MTRLAYTYGPPDALATLPTTASEFGSTLGRSDDMFASRRDLLAFARQGWFPELHLVLRRVLRQDRTILSVGSGFGEHEAVLVVDGYRVTASDIIPGVLDEAHRLLPELAIRHLDVLDPDVSVAYDDVLILGLDYALDDAQLAAALRNARRLLRPKGRVVLVIRCRDTIATRIVDQVLVPAWARYRRRRGQLLERRILGFRRSSDEVIAMALREGFDTALCVGHAGFAAELTRIGLDLKARHVYALARRIDQRRRLLNTAAVLVFERA